MSKTTLDETFRKLQKQGEILFGTVAGPLNRLTPDRERTREEFEQICVALALFVHHLLDSEDEGCKDPAGGHDDREKNRNLPGRTLVGDAV